MVRVQTIRSQMEMATKCRMSSAICETHRNGSSLTIFYTDDHFVVNSALQDQMKHATKLLVEFRPLRGV